MTDALEPETMSLYEAAGGMPYFVALVDAFYAGVVTDPVLLPLLARLITHIPRLQNNLVIRVFARLNLMS